MGQSLFRSSILVAKAGVARTCEIGDYEVTLEPYTQADIDANVAAIEQGTATGCTFGDSDQSKVVLVCGETLTIPSGFTLTPASPKKSLVICCNTLINNGTISMTAKGPNVLPHDWFILGEDDYVGSDIIIPAYANNRVGRYATTGNGKNGNNGTNRQCGSGGTGSHTGDGNTMTVGASGSGSAFAGGGGGPGLDGYSPSNVRDVNTTYPMRGGSGAGGTFGSCGGVGNPKGNVTNGSHVNRSNVVSQNTGVGGRLIVYCVDFENNGTLSADGVATKRTWTVGNKYCANFGGASGAGAVDLFYTNLVNQGDITATGGGTFTYYSTPGKGGDGSITSLNWELQKVILPTVKYMSRDNMLYFLQGLVNKRGGN